jgi:hypothetical protein
VKRTIAFVLFFITLPAPASFNPVVTPSIVTLKAGETTTLPLTTWWSGLAPLPQRNVFGSDAPAVAEISGSLTWAGDFSVAPVLDPIHVTALAPGIAHVIDLGLRRPYATIVVACDPPGSGIAFPAQERVTATTWQPLTLEVLTAGFDNPSYDWFEGSTGDFRIPLSSREPATQQVFYAPGLFHVWAEVWDQCHYATVEFTVEVTPAQNRRRSVRH